MEHQGRIAKGSGRFIPLRDCPFPRALAELSAEKRTGTLSVRSAGQEKHLIIKAGAPVHIESDIAEEALDRFLVARGELDENVAFEALSRAIVRKLDIGEVLVEMGALAPHELFKALKRRLGMSILSAFAWAQGEVNFDANTPDVDRKILLRVSPAPLVFRGVCSYTPIATIRADAHDDLTRELILLPGTEELVPTLRFNTTESRVVNALRRPNDQAALVSEARVDPELVERIVYGLALLGVVGPADELEPEERESASQSLPVLAAETDPQHDSAPAMVRQLEVLSAPAPPRGVSPNVTFAAAAAPVEPLQNGPLPLSRAERDAIDEAYLLAKRRNYFKLLGVPENFRFDQLKAAFLDKCDTLSPAAYRDRDIAEHGDRLEELFLILVRAFSTLAVPATRNAHRDQLTSSDAEPPDKKTARRARPARDEPKRNAFAVTEPANASVHIRTAITFINTGQPDQAARGLHAIVDDEPDNALTLAFLGYATYLADPVSSLSEAVRYIQRALAVDAQCIEPMLFLGRIFEFQQDRANALSAYQGCLQISPNHKEATQAVQRLRRLAT